MSCNEEHLYMLKEGCILEEVAAEGLSLENSSTVDHLQKDHSDHTGRVAGIYQDRQQE